MMILLADFGEIVGDALIKTFAVMMATLLPFVIIFSLLNRGGKKDKSKK